MRMIYIVPILILWAPGCAAIADKHYEATQACRCEAAWLGAAKSPLQWVCPADYGCGWKAGYYDVSTGSCGTPPSLPPQKYWSPHYQSAAGQDAVAAWYQGYADGANEAAAKGAGDYHYLRAPLTTIAPLPRPSANLGPVPATGPTPAAGAKARANENTIRPPEPIFSTLPTQ